MVKKEKRGDRCESCPLPRPVSPSAQGRSGDRRRSDQSGPRRCRPGSALLVGVDAKELLPTQQHQGPAGARQRKLTIRNVFKPYGVKLKFSK